MIEISSQTVAQLLYLVHSDPEELQEALGELRAADIASMSGPTFLGSIR